MATAGPIERIKKAAIKARAGSAGTRPAPVPATDSKREA